jgi:hypothetical protein
MRYIPYLYLNGKNELDCKLAGNTILYIPPTPTPTSTPAILDYSGSTFNYDFQNFRTYPGTGNILYDVSGNGNNGTIVSGGTYQGSSSPYYYSMTTGSSITTNVSGNGNYCSFLYGGWFKVNSTGTAIIFMQKGYDGGGWPYVVGLQIGINSSNQIYAYFKNVIQSVSPNIITSSAIMIPGYWYNIMAYYNYNLPGCYLYVNGVQDPNVPGFTQPNLAATNETFHIGGLTSGTGIGNSSPFDFGEVIEYQSQPYNSIAASTIVPYNYNQKLRFYSIAPTPTPTPTPTSTPTVGVSIKYVVTVVGFPGSTDNLNYSGLNVTNSVGLPTASITSFGTPDNGSSHTGTTVSGFTSPTTANFTASRTACRTSGTITYSSAYTLSINVNGVQVATYNGPSAGTLTTTCSSPRTQSHTLSGISIKNGDSVVIYWNDNG